VLFLDEPTIGLDPQSREHMWDHIRMLRKREDMTIILTTHYMEEADRLCDRVAIIDHGKIVALDKPSVLKKSLGGDTIILGIQDGESLRALLAGNGMAEKVEVHNGEVRVTVANANSLLPRIMEAAAGAGIHIDYVYLNHPDMNDVFIHYTGRDLRHEEAKTSMGKMAMMRRRRVR
jgi:ABC-2 type transport system ATP-binding protein